MRNERKKVWFPHFCFRILILARISGRLEQDRFRRIGSEYVGAIVCKLDFHKKVKVL